MRHPPLRRDARLQHGLRPRLRQQRRVPGDGATRRTRSTCRWWTGRRTRAIRRASAVGAARRSALVTPSFQQAALPAPRARQRAGAGLPARWSRSCATADRRTAAWIVLRELRARASRSWTSAPDRGPASAINAGLEQAGGEVVSWLNSTTCWRRARCGEVGRAPSRTTRTWTSWYGNALVRTTRRVASTGDRTTAAIRTGLYYGAFQPVDRIPALLDVRAQPCRSPPCSLGAGCSSVCGLPRRVLPLHLRLRAVLPLRRAGRPHHASSRAGRVLPPARGRQDQRLVALPGRALPLQPSPAGPHWGRRSTRQVLRGFLNHSLAQRFGSHRGC